MRRVIISARRAGQRGHLVRAPTDVAAASVPTVNTIAHPSPSSSGTRTTISFCGTWWVPEKSLTGVHDGDQHVPVGHVGQRRDDDLGVLGEHPRGAGLLLGGGPGFGTVIPVIGHDPSQSRSS